MARMFKAERAKAEQYLRDVWGLDPQDLLAKDSGFPSVAAALKENVLQEPLSKWPLDYMALRLIIEAQKKAGDYKASDDADLPARKMKAVLVAGNKPTGAAKAKGRGINNADYLANGPAGTGWRTTS